MMNDKNKDTKVLKMIDQGEIFHAIRNELLEEFSPNNKMISSFKYKYYNQATEAEFNDLILLFEDEKRKTKLNNFYKKILKCEIKDEITLNELKIEKQKNQHETHYSYPQND